MQLDDFLSEMGYRDSPNFLSGDALGNDSDNGYVYRKAIEKCFSRNASLPTFRLVLQKVKEWLNGSVFPPSDAAITRVGQQRLREVVGTFRGDNPGGQLHLDFEAYDFSFIPIETLSVIYEQFLHSADSETEESTGKSRGAYYTPLPLVGFVIDRLNQIKPLTEGCESSI